MHTRMGCPGNCEESRLSSDADGDGSGDSPHSFTILLADDDNGFRETLRFWLAEDERWEIREATDGKEALEKLDETVDVLILDRRMPDLSGPEVVERLDETSFDGEVVVLSAFDQDAHLNEETVAGYTTKPIEREEFIDQLETVL